MLMSLFLPSEVRGNLIGRFMQTRWDASAMTSIAVWTTRLIPYMCRMIMGIPMINLSANAAFGVALIRADVISLALYLRGMHAGCNHPRPRPLTRLASSSHSTMMNPSSVTRNGESRRHQVTKPHCGTHHIIEGNVGCVRCRSRIRLPYCQHIIGKPHLL